MFIAFVVFSMFAILVVGAGAQARLAYSMSRDNMLPFSGTLRKVNRSTQTPIMALLVFAVVDIGVTWYGYLQASAFATLVGATAIIPYIIYFLITAGYAYKRRTLDSIPGAFSLGRWAWPVIIFVLIYSALIIFVLSVPGSVPRGGQGRRLRCWASAAVVRGRAVLAAAARCGGCQERRGAGRLTSRAAGRAGRTLIRSPAGQRPRRSRRTATCRRPDIAAASRATADGK